MWRDTWLSRNVDNANVDIAATGIA
jgi:hypothetical protein